MYARVITVQYQPGKLDEGEQMYRESVLPEARRQRGFQGIMALVDRSSGKAISISLWQTEADVQASAPDSAYARRRSLPNSPPFGSQRLPSKRMRLLSESKPFAVRLQQRNSISCLGNR